jgi:hypothetical protein
MQMVILLRLDSAIVNGASLRGFDKLAIDSIKFLDGGAVGWD